MENNRVFLRRNWRSIFILVTVAFDAVAIVSSAILVAFFLHFVPFFPPVSFKFFVFFIAYSVPVLIFSGLVLGLYRAAFHSNERLQNRMAGKAYAYSFLIILASFSLFKLTDFQRGFVLPFFLVLPGMFLYWRFMLSSLNLFMQRRGFGIRKALIVGYENGGVEVFHRFTGFPELGYEVRGIVSKRKLSTRSPKDGTVSLPHYPMSHVDVVVKKEAIDRIFIPSRKFIANGYAELINVCKKRNVKLKVLSPEADQLLRMAKVYDIAGITLYAPPRTRIESVRRAWKRLFDIVGSSIFILVLSPIFVITALAIYIESGRPLIFKQKRSSTKRGKSFYFYKFRSMVKNADELKESLYCDNESDGALFKIKNDPRLTRVGRFIRKFSIDELPQLFNVFKGEMSLVGPRPLPISDFHKVNEEPEFWEAIKDREKVKPGITGLWQISGRSNIGFREMVLLDLYYVENQSLLFDLEILFATIPVVLFGKGAY